RGFYVGAYYSQNKKDADVAPFADFVTFVYDYFSFIPTQSTTSFDTKDSGYGFFGGYRLFNNLAFEGGYVDQGSVVYRDQSTGIDNEIGQSTWTQKVSSESKSMSVSALGILPLSYRSEVFVRGGIMFTNSILDLHISNGTDSASDETHESDTDFLAGIGAGFTFAEIYTVRIEYQRVFDAGDENTDEADLDMAIIGVTVAF
ncbi:MAG TPA: outer membrane beta-barrel protein, partial [Povalibacter sp.]